MESFKELNLPEQIVQSLENGGFTKPTPIQAAAIPVAIEGKDLIGSAQTGTGKTIAFIVPILNYLINNPKGKALILTPTRELAQQVEKAAFKLLGRKSFIKSALIIGGESFGKQFAALRENPRIIVGTPGRLIDHFERNTIPRENINFLVLDETDRMFEMGDGDDMDKIISYLPKEKQTLMFSATLVPRVENLAGKYLKNPVRISMDATIVPVGKLKQETIEVSESEKYQKLLVQLQNRDGTIIVFVKTKASAENLALDLISENHSASAIHGDLKQQKRDRVMNAFRQGRCRIMVATDIAARGLDVPHILHVINYDLPQSPADYIHRIGRTARAGADGNALNFVSSQDRKRWQAIQRLLNTGEETPMSELSHKRGKSANSNSKFSRSSGPRRHSNSDSNSRYAPRNSSSTSRDDSSSRYAPRNSSSDSRDDSNSRYAPRNSSGDSRDDSNSRYAPRNASGNGRDDSSSRYAPRNSSSNSRDDSNSRYAPRNSGSASRDDSSSRYAPRNSGSASRDDSNSRYAPRNSSGASRDDSRSAPRNNSRRDSTNKKFEYKPARTK